MPTQIDIDDCRLTLERELAAPRDAVWRCWTESGLLKQWFCPPPWKVAEADFDLRPGGRMNTTMAGPNGERMEGKGCWLEIVPGQRLVFTDSFAEGFVPQPNPFMTSSVELSDGPDGKTRMVWTARHATEDAKRQHLDMNWEQGWNTAADQLEALAKTLTD